MASSGQEEYYYKLKIPSDSAVVDIQRAYRSLALQYHPDRPDNKDKCSLAKFEEVTKAYWKLTSSGFEDRDVDSDQVFFKLFKDVLLSRKGDLSIYAFFTNNTHVGVRGQVDDMYIEDDDENDTGEQEFDTFVEICENRRKKGKPVPDGFTSDKLDLLRETLLEEKDAVKKEFSKKLNSQKVKPPSQVPVSKPKPKSKKQKAAEQRRREREMEAIADEIADKIKLEEERAEKKKIAELEKQKRQEEEKARQAAEEKRKREKEEKERLEREKREREEEEARQREEEKRREKEEKKKKAAAAKQLKQQAEQKAKEEEEKKKGAEQTSGQKVKQSSPQQSIPQTSQAQQQKTQQAYPPREVPPRFAQKQQQQKQQKMQQGGKKVAQWGGQGWGEEEEGDGWTDGYSATHQSDNQEIGTWQNPETSWGSTTTNDIIVDTKDKEAWPSIGADQGSNASEAGDDNASVKSGSVISSSSNPGQQGLESGQGTSAMKSQSASNGWGVTPNDVKMDNNSPWGFGAANSPGTLNSSGWGGNPPTSSAVNNQGLHMQSYQNTASGDNTLNSGLGGWGMNNAAQGSNQRSQNAMQAQKPGAQFMDNNGPQMAANKQPGAIGNSALWPGISNLGTGVHKPQVNQDTAWNISDSGSANTAGKTDGGMKNGTDHWGSANPQQSMQQQNWGMPAAKQNSSKGWGQPSPVPSPNPPNPTGWMQPDKTSMPPQQTSMPPPQSGMPPPQSGMPPPQSGMPPQQSGMPPQQSGMPPQQSGMPPQQTGMPPQQSGMPPQQSGWGNLPPVPPQQQPNSQMQGQPPPRWGSQNTPMNAAPMNAAPMNAAPNPAKTQPSTWAQAAGKGLNTSANNTGNPCNTAVDNASATGHLETEISRAVNSKDGWGQRPVKQDLSWEVEVSPRTKRRELEKANSNVWNQQVNNGTSIWESTKQVPQNTANPPPSNWNSEPTRVSTSNTSGWGETNDSNTWNGPPQESSNWGGPPPQKTNWMNPSANQNPNASSAWGSANDNQGQNQWGGNKPDTSGNWGASAPPPPRASTSSWDGAGSNRSSGSWGDTNGQKSVAPAGWGDAASSGAAGNAGAAGSGNNMNNPTPSWGEPPPTRTSTSSWDGGNNRGGGWGDGPPPVPPPKKEIKPSGWEEPSPQTPGKNVDTGVSFWGDPTGHHKPVQNWSSNPSTPSTPLTPTPRPKPDDAPPLWDKPPPSTQTGGWGDVNAPPKVDSASSLWTSAISQPQTKGSSWETPQTNQWNSGAKPKTPSTSSNWGTTIDSWNKPSEPGQAWPDDVSVWGEDDSGVQENASWSSAKDWNKKKAAMKGANMGGSYKNQPQMRIKLLQQLMDMGFKKEDAQNALISNNMNLDSAIADLLAGASVDRNKDLDMTDPQKAALLKVRNHQRLHDNMNNGNEDHAEIHSDPNQFVPPISMQNTQPFSSAQSQVPNPQAIANALKQGPSLTPSSLGSLTNTSISPSLQQKIIQHPLLGQQQQQQQTQQQPPQQANQQQQVLQGQNIAQGQRGIIPSQSAVQQQLVQQQLVQQLRMAVQAGLINPQLLNQQFTPQMLSILQQLLQQQNILQRLMTQQQMIQQNKSNVNNPLAQRQQEQVNLMIQKIKQQIGLLQGQLGQAYNKTGAAGVKDSPGSNDLVGGLQTDFSNFGMKDPVPQQQTQSRLTQWKLPSPEKDNISEGPGAAVTPTSTDSTLNKAPGSKPITQSHSSSNLQAQSSKFDFHRSLSIGGDSTWSALTSTTESDWPTTTATATSGSASVLESGRENLDDNSKCGLVGGTPSNTPPSTTSSSTFNLNDMIPEFIPGKPWQGVATKNIEDDPHITPGSISRSLSVNTIKDEYLNNLTKQVSVSNSNTAGDSTANSSTWSYSNFSKSTATSQARSSNWPTSASNTPTSLTSELWGVPMQPSKAAATRPPPGLGNQKNPWGSSSSGQQQQQQQQQQNYNRSISWGGDKSAFTAGAKKGMPPPPQSDAPSHPGGAASVSNTSWDGRAASSWLVLKNLTPQIDGSTLKTLCMQHGPLMKFHLNLNSGLALVCYQSKEEAMKAQKSLNACILGNTTILAEFAGDGDLAQLGDPNFNTSSSSLWSAQPQQAPPQSTPHAITSMQQQASYQRSQGQQMNNKYDVTTSQWNGANLGGAFQGGGGMWSSGHSNLWGSAGLTQGLFPGDILGSESM